MNTTTSRRRRSAQALAVIAVAAVAAVLAGCAATSTPPAASESPGASASPAASESPEPADITVAMFGDSWGYGAHCGDCTPWPELLEAGYEQKLGASVDAINLFENGGTSDSLLAEFRDKTQYRDAISEADVVIINIGSNDFDQFYDVFAKHGVGTCGGSDNLDCLSELTDHWRQNFDALATEIETLRKGRPTALRLVGLSNEYLVDKGLSFMGPEMGAATFGGYNDVSCEVATAHGGACVDLRPVLNGPTGDEPRDAGSQDAMQDVADAIVAVGLVELGW